MTSLLESGYKKLQHSSFQKSDRKSVRKYHTRILGHIFSESAISIEIVQRTYIHKATIKNR